MMVAQNLSLEKLQTENTFLKTEVSSLKEQLEWFKR